MTRMNFAFLILIHLINKIIILLYRIQNLTYSFKSLLISLCMLQIIFFANCIIDLEDNKNWNVIKKDISYLRISME